MATSFFTKPIILSVVVASGLLVALGVYSLIGDTKVEVHVGAGLSPAISWTLPEGFSTVQVFQGEYEPGMAFDSDQVMWWIESTEGQQIYSPVGYGAPVHGARTIQAPRNLVEGETYTVYMFRDASSFSGDGNAYEAIRTFTATK